MPSGDFRVFKTSSSASRARPKMRRPERTPSCGATESSRAFRKAATFLTRNCCNGSSNARASRSQSVTCRQSARPGFGGEQTQFESEPAIGAGAGNQRQPFANRGQNSALDGAAQFAPDFEQAAFGQTWINIFQNKNQRGRLVGSRRFPSWRRPARRRSPRRCNPRPPSEKKSAARSKPGREPDSSGDFQPALRRRWRAKSLDIF